MFTFYDLEVFKYDWFAVFESDGELTEIHNDMEALRRFLSNTQILIGYNNYNYDDRVAASILKNINPYETSQKIISGKRFNLKLQNPLTLDVMQELKGLSLKEAQANLKQDIIETPIDFNLDRPLTKSEIRQVFKYCKNDVLVTKELFEERSDYFTTKFEIVKEFKLEATSLKRTRANLAAEVLKSKPATDKDRLVFDYDERLIISELPAPVVKFYEEIEKSYKAGESFETLEREKLNYKLAGIDHIFGFGGLHGAIENYKGEGNYMQIDVSSYYPSLILNNEFLKDESLDTYKKLYHTRQQLKLSDDPKEVVHKVLLNATYGAMKSKYNGLFNPRMANNIVVNGQLILTHLICVLEGFCELIQTNTDGIIIKYEKGFDKQIIKLLELFEEQYNLQFDVDLITKIVQRDVNNYVIQKADGKIKAKGRFANYEGGNFERNSLAVIDKCLVDYYLHGTRINKIVIELWKANKLEFFQFVAKAGKYDGMAQEIKEETLLEGSYSSRFEELQDTNRIFATKDKFLGGVYKTKGSAGADIKYTKVPYTSDNCLVWNGPLEKMDKRRIDLNWYIKEVEKWVF